MARSKKKSKGQKLSKSTRWKAKAAPASEVASDTPEPTTTATQSKTYSGKTRDVVAELIDDGAKQAVLDVVTRLEAEIQKLQYELARLKGGKDRSSETLSQKQLALLFSELEALKNATLEDELAPGFADEKDTTLEQLGELDRDLEKKAREPKPPSRPERRPHPPSLPRVDNPLPVQDPSAQCPCCDGVLVSREPEIHEVLDYRPGGLFVRRDIREIKVCRECDGHVVRGPLGDKVIPGGAYGSALIAELVLKKFRDGMTLHRIADWMQQMGFAIPSASLSDQILWATDLLMPVWRVLLDQVTSSTVMQLDGTGIPVHHKEKGKAQEVRTATLWAAVGDGCAAVYAYSSTGHKRGQRLVDLGPENLLSMRQGGFVVVDADGKFDRSFRRKELLECGCAMHARRYFIRALDAGNKRAAYPLGAIQKLYALERRFEELELLGDKLVEQRQARSKPVWEGLLDWCRHEWETGPPTSSLTIAARYLVKNYEALTRHLSDGRIPIDNGLTERLFRRVAILRRNALFVGSHDGGRRAAVLLSILSTCELIGLNPALYLADILPTLTRGITIATDLPALMPAAWLAAHPDAAVPRKNLQRVTEFV